MFVIVLIHPLVSSLSFRRIWTFFFMFQKYIISTLVYHNSLAFISTNVCHNFHLHSYLPQLVDTHFHSCLPQLVGPSFPFMCATTCKTFISTHVFHNVSHTLISINVLCFHKLNILIAHCTILVLITIMTLFFTFWKASRNF
jgi:hypothetical protein